MKRMLNNKYTKITFILILLIVIISTIGYGSYYFVKNKDYDLKERTGMPIQVDPPGNKIPPSNITAPSEAIFTYPALQSKHQSIKSINIIPIYFLAADQTSQIKPEWDNNLAKILTEVTNFYEQQFDNKITVTHSEFGNITRGDLPLASYSFQSLRNEIYEKNKNLAKAESFNIWTVSVVRNSPSSSINEDIGGISGDGSGLTSSIPFVATYEFWLDNEAVNGADRYGTQGFAHEIGHALGIPHPWELGTNTTHDPNYGNIPGDIMGYSNNYKLLQNLYIRDDIKKKMGL